MGSNRAGKSTPGFIEHLSHVMGYRHDGTKDNIWGGIGDHLVMMTDKRKQVDKVFMSKLRKYANMGWVKRIKNGTDGFPEIVEWINGARSFLGSYNQLSSIWEGVDFLTVWFDEPPPVRMWGTIWRGLTDTGGKAWLTLTPLRCAWIYNLLWARTDGNNIASFHILLDDNPYITQQFIEEFKLNCPPWEYDARVLGKFSHIVGAVFPEFSRKIHVVPQFYPEESMPIYQVVDPHSARPNVMLWVAIDANNGWWLFDEWPNENFFEMRHTALSVSDYLGITASKEARFKDRVVDRIMDPLAAKAKNFTSGLTLVDEYSAVGLDYYTDINNDIAVGHDRIHELMRCAGGMPPRLHVSEHCRNFITACEIYAWEEQKGDDVYSTKEKPSDAGKDHIDCMRYLADYGPSHVLGQKARVLPGEFDPESPDGGSGGGGYGY